MQIRWSTAAAQDFFRIIEYIQRDNAGASRRVADTIYENVGSLGEFPHRGRIGRLEGTREIADTFTPFHRGLSSG